MVPCLIPALLLLSSWHHGFTVGALTAITDSKSDSASGSHPSRTRQLSRASHSEVVLLRNGVEPMIRSTTSIDQTISGEELSVIFLHQSAASVARRADNVFMEVTDHDTVLHCERAEEVDEEASTCPRFSRCPGTGDSIQFCGSDGFMPGDELAVQPWRFRELCVRNVSPSAERYMLESTRMMPSQCPFSSYMSLRRQVFSWKDEYLSLPDPQEAKAAERRAAKRETPEGPFEGWAGMVFLLHDVFVDRWGRVFNDTHFFHAGRCSDITTQLSFPQGSKVTAMDELFNLMVDSEDRWYTELAEKLPLFLSLVPLLDQLQSTPVLISKRQQERQWWGSLVGLQMEGPTVVSVTSKSLLRVKRLYMPLFQPCGKPSAALWHSLRSKHLLPPQGLPILPTAATQGVIAHAPLAVFPNTSAPLDYRSWVAVVALPSASTTTAEEFSALSDAAKMVERILMAMLGRDRVVLYESLHPTATRQLFNRALLLVGCGNRLVNTIFMPFVSAVLELRYTPTPHSSHPLFPSSPYPKSGTTLYRDLAIASGVKHYSLDCSLSPAGTAPSGPCGGKERIHVALEGVVRDILASDAFNPSLLDRFGQGFANRIPGTPVQTVEGATQFRAWQQCVTRSGAWVKNLTPRRLPWMYNGHYAICEYKHRERGGMAIHAADVVADRWVRHSSGPEPVSEKGRRHWENKWQVRESVKYEWQASPSCGTWERFSAGRLCDLAKLRGEERSFNLLVIGDSLQGQLVTALVNNIVVPFKKPVDVNETVVEECLTWTAGNKAAKDKFCTLYRISRACRDTFINIKYIRNDLLFISSHDHTYKFLPWNRMLPTIQWADAIVLNRGAHYSMNMAFRSGIRAALRHLRTIAPDRLIIVRSTAPGHLNCTSYTEPISEPQDSDTLPFNWGRFKAQNRIVKYEVERIGGVYMDIYPMTVLRADGHCGNTLSGKLDCLHYCFPGPVDTWAQLLMNILLQLLENWPRDVL